MHGDGTLVLEKRVCGVSSVEPDAVGFVISQDSQVGMISNVNDSVWAHAMI
jgi:hypothetical protein